MNNNQANFASKMTIARLLSFVIGCKLAARVFGFRAHWVRSAKECGWSVV